MRKLKRAHELATSAIDALNSLYAAPVRACRARPPPADAWPAHVAEVHKYLFDCCCDFAVTPVSSDECASQVAPEGEEEAYDDLDLGGPTPLIADMVSLPTNAGTFPVVDYVGPELAAYARAESPACKEHELAPQLCARLARSCHRVSAEEYVKVIARMCKNNMAELLPCPADFILGLFGRWKQIGTSQRMLGDARPPNCLFDTPEFVHTGGDSLARMQVAAALKVFSWFSHCRCSRLHASSTYYSSHGVVTGSRRHPGRA